MRKEKEKERKRRLEVKKGRGELSFKNRIWGRKERRGEGSSTAQCRQ